MYTSIISTLYCYYRTIQCYMPIICITPSMLPMQCGGGGGKRGAAKGRPEERAWGATGSPQRPRLQQGPDPRSTQQWGGECMPHMELIAIYYDVLWSLCRERRKTLKRVCKKRLRNWTTMTKSSLRYVWHICNALVYWCVLIRTLYINRTCVVIWVSLHVCHVSL